SSRSPAVGPPPALPLTTSRASAATNRPDGSANSQVVTPSERAPLLPLAIRKDDGSCAVCANTPGSCAVPGAEARSDNARWSVTRESWAPSGSGHGVPYPATPRIFARNPLSSAAVFLAISDAGVLCLVLSSVLAL